ncbi:hypothetical protein CRM22_003441 [Opisthorchis felineus]|uniref:Generative cell specific-1/HAP2 domain-containing protein n=2 Tax=Opisthorchis felineus TaxID=147828 RepID=A0A4S2M786_OPIFE|nr:hypothetical protein CRM22_003441 [Opisthorchis felineus]
MLLLSTCLILLTAYLSKAEWALVEVLLLVPNEQAGGTDDCDLIIQRNRKIWEDKSVYGCDIRTQTNQTGNQSELLMYIKLNVSNLPEDYPVGLSYDFRMWYLSRLLNGGNTTCAVTTGRAQSKDAIPSTHVSAYAPRKFIPNMALTMPRDRFVLVGPYVEGFCDQLNERMFNRRRLYLSGCQIVENSTVPVNGHVLAKYYLDTTEFRCDLEPYEYYDVHTLFLQELNMGAQECLFNGYWGGVQDDELFDYKVHGGDYDDYLEDYNFEMYRE